MPSKPLLIGVLLVAGSALAADVWTTPYPGIRMLQRTTSRPVVFWALEIDACAPGIRFRATTPAEGTRRTSSFGRLVGAQMAINGDFADHDFGLNVGSGQRWSTPDTTHSGNFSVGANRLEMTPNEVLLAAPAPWVTEQLGGRWTLLANGVPRYGIDDNGPTTSGGFVCAPGLRHPRTAIGLSQDRRKVFIIVADGRSSSSVGMTCDELIDVFRELGAHDAMGLDGGGSSTLWQSDRLINHPSDSTGERTVRNHLAIFASGTGPAPHCVAPPVTEPAQATRVPGAPVPALRALTPPLRFVPLAATRLFDTRSAADSAGLVRSDGATGGPLSGSRSGSFSAWSGGPADAVAAWLNVAALGGDAAGFLRVVPGGVTASTSTLTFGADQVVANAAPVALGAGAVVRFEASAEAHLVVDRSGVFAPSTGVGLQLLGPRRVHDSRASGGLLQAGLPRVIDVGAPQGALAVSATVTLVGPAAAGFATVYPCGSAPPATSSVNFAAGDVAANAVVSALGSGQLCVVSTASAHLVVDVTGVFSAAAPLGFVPVAPERALDTRARATAWTGRAAAGQVLELPLAAMPGAEGVVANVVALSSDVAGFVTAFACGGAAPGVSTLNFGPGEVVSGLAVAKLGPGGLCLVSSARAHLVVDLVGAWAPLPAEVVDAGASAPPEVDAGVSAAPDGGVGERPPPPSVADSGADPAPTDPESSPGAPDPAGAVVGAGCAAAPGMPLLPLGLAVLRHRRRRAFRYARRHGSAALAVDREPHPIVGLGARRL